MFLWFEPQRLARAHSSDDDRGRLVRLSAPRAWRGAQSRALSATRQLLRTHGNGAARRLADARRAACRRSRSTTRFPRSRSSACAAASCSCPRGCSGSAMPTRRARCFLHECAHVRGPRQLHALRDPRVPGLRSVERGALDLAWDAASEEAADATVAAAAPQLALSTCAGADSRRPPRAASVPPELASALYLGGSIESRVRRLLSPPASLLDRSPSEVALTPIGRGRVRRWLSRSLSERPQFIKSSRCLVATLP